MAPVITLYILAGCVAAAAALFVVMIVLSALRPPQLPSIAPPLQRMMRALTPLPVATSPAIPSRMFDEAPTTTMPRGRQAKAFAIPPMPQGFEPAARSAAPARAARSTATPPPIPKAPAFAPQQRSAPTFAPPAPSFAPQAPSFAPPQPPAPALAPSPFVWEMPAAKGVPYVVVPGPAKAPSKSARPDLQRRPISLPRYPKRKRKLLRFVVAFFVFSTLSAGAVIAYPALLDPLCDDYEWFGGDATQVVREYARDANAAIYTFIRDL